MASDGEFVGEGFAGGGQGLAGCEHRGVLVGHRSESFKFVPGFRARGLQLYRTLAEISFDNGGGVLPLSDQAG